MLTCVVTAMVMLGLHGPLRQSKVVLKGEILGRNSEYFLMDFSKDKQVKELYGDYSKVFVKLNDCVKQ